MLFKAYKQYGSKMRQNPRNIWLVEDEQSYADSLTYILNNISDLRCKKHFPSSEDLQEYIDSPMYNQAPDLVLMDIRLPGISGIEAVKMLKEKLPGIPVVMMTFNEDKKSIVEAMKAGAVSYIVKGSPFDQVVGTVRAALDGGLMVNGTVKDKLLEHLHEADNPRDYELTDRQMEVLLLMCEGMSKAQIADQLSIRHATADNHFRHIYQKLGVNSAHAAVSRAFKDGLVSMI